MLLQLTETQHVTQALFSNEQKTVVMHVQSRVLSKYFRSCRPLLLHLQRLEKLRTVELGLR